MHPTKDEFKEIVRAAPSLDEVVRTHLFVGVPFVFDERPDDYDALRSHVAGGLALAGDDLTLVGSARIGFSLSPRIEEFGRPFSSRSDLDLVVVSAMLFDKAWLELLNVKNYCSLSAQAKAAHVDHKTRHVFNGQIWPSKLGGIVEIAPNWFRTFQSIGARYPELAGFDVNGVLYRTWEHALAYHVGGLRQIRSKINKGEY